MILHAVLLLYRRYLSRQWRFCKSCNLKRQLHFFELLVCYCTCRLSKILWYVDRSSGKSLSGAMKTRYSKPPCLRGTVTSQSRSRRASPPCWIGEAPVRTTARPGRPLTSMFCVSPESRSPGLDLCRVWTKSAVAWSSEPAFWSWAPPITTPYAIAPSPTPDWGAIVTADCRSPEACQFSGYEMLNALCCIWVMLRDGLICGKLTFARLPVEAPSLDVLGKSGGITPLCRFC